MVACQRDDRGGGRKRDGGWWSPRVFLRQFEGKANTEVGHSASLQPTMLIPRFVLSRVEIARLPRVIKLDSSNSLLGSYYSSVTLEFFQLHPRLTTISIEILRVSAISRCYDYSIISPTLPNWSTRKIAGIVNRQLLLILRGSVIFQNRTWQYDRNAFKGHLNIRNSNQDVGEWK